VTASLRNFFHLALEASFFCVENSLPQKRKSVRAELQILSMHNRFGLKILTVLDCNSPYRAVVRPFRQAHFIWSMKDSEVKGWVALTGR